MGVYKLSEAGGILTPRTYRKSMLAGNPRYVAPFALEYVVVAGGGGTGRGSAGGGGAGGFRSSVTGECLVAGLRLKRL